jgi:4-hydroxybenzoate polyprenyltransferase
MLQELKGFAQFISIERGLMLFMISMGATFLVGQSFKLLTALYLGVTVFCIWSSGDAINNVFDIGLDSYSDPFRALFTKKLGKIGVAIFVGFALLSLALGAISSIPLVILFVGLGLSFGVLYSVPPFRFRKTVYKPIINFTVGAVPILIVAAFFNAFSINVIVFAFLIGITTSIHSLWEDLADFTSDSESGSRTLPIILGFHKGILLTLIVGYIAIPLMALVGWLFELGWFYYSTLVGLGIFGALRIFQQRANLKNDKLDPQGLVKLGGFFAKDFVIIAIVFTFSLLISSLIKFSPSWS